MMSDNRLSEKNLGLAVISSVTQLSLIFSLAEIMQSEEEYSLFRAVSTYITGKMKLIINTKAHPHLIQNHISWTPLETGEFPQI